MESFMAQPGHVPASLKFSHDTLGMYRVSIVGRHGYRGGSVYYHPQHTYSCFSICTACGDRVIRSSQLHMECLHVRRGRRVWADFSWCIQSSDDRVTQRLLPNHWRVCVADNLVLNLKFSQLRKGCQDLGVQQDLRVGPQQKIKTNI